MIKHDAVGLGMHHHNNGGQDNPVRRKGTYKQPKDSETTLLPLLGVQKKLSQAKQPNVCRGPGTDPCRLNGCHFSFCDGPMSHI